LEVLPPPIKDAGLFVLITETADPLFGLHFRWLASRPLITLA